MNSAEPSFLSNLKRILVIKPKPLGDVMMATPVVRSLRRHFPDAWIAFVAEPPYTELLEGNPHVNEIIPFERDRTGTWAFWRRLRAGRFDAVLDLWCTSRTVGWTLATGAPVRVGFNHRIRRWAYTVKVHSRATYAADINLDCVRALGLAETKPQPEIHLNEAERASAGEWLSRHGGSDGRPPVMIAPGAGWPSKRWPASKFAALADRLGQEGGARVLVLCGPQDESTVHDVINRLRTVPAIVRGTTLRQTAALIGRMKLYIGNDSGPMHLAVAQDIPTITLLGPNNSDFIAPFGPHREVRHPVPCSPCNQRLCPLLHHDCLEKLEVDTVFHEVMDLLRR